MADAQLRLEDDVKAPVLRSSQDLQQLVSEHHHLDEKIRHLSALSYLTDQQQYAAPVYRAGGERSGGYGAELAGLFCRVEASRCAGGNAFVCRRRPWLRVAGIDIADQGMAATG